VISMTPKGGLLAMLAAWLAGVPRRVHCFTGQVWATRRGFSRWLLKSMDRLMVLCATRLLADSGSQREYLMEQGIVDPGKIEVLANGSMAACDIQRFQPDAACQEPDSRAVGDGRRRLLPAVRRALDWRKRDN
jgi:hypothetical protein